mgnify:CR=1 FL=1
MNHKLSVFFSQRLVRSGIITKEHEELYTYGFELILSFIFSVFIVLTIGTLSNKVVETIIFLSLFVFLRQFTGGFHANTYSKCQICTVCFYISVITMAKKLHPNVLAFSLLLIFGSLTIFLIGPIESANKPLSDTQKKINRMRGLVLYVFACLLGIYIFDIMPDISSTIFYSLLLIIILMIIPFLERRIHNA